MGVNTYGVVAGIANLFVNRDPVPPARKVSRGLLVRKFLDSPSSLQVERRVLAFDLEPFEPFTLVALEVGRAPVILRWDRSALSPVEPLGSALLVTSAGDSRSIETSRIRLFEAESRNGELTASRVEELYRAPPNGDDSSICVHRPEVSTVSLTRIEVSPLQVSLTYTPGQPCQTPAGPTILLERVSNEKSEGVKSEE